MIRETLQTNQMTNTHILVNDFVYLEPTTVLDAISLLSAYGDRARLLAGGTYLLVQMKMERQAPDYVINIQKIADLCGFSWQNGGLDLRPGTSIYSVRSAREIWSGYTALAEACAAFGSTQIQKMGTIGGNICNGSPASDAVPALMAFDAQLTLTGPDGERILPVEDFLLGPGKTEIMRGELLTSIRLQPTAPGTGSAFIKLSRVSADLAKVSAAAVLVCENEQIVACRLAFGSVAPTVVRAKAAEMMLVGRTFSSELALEVGRVASEEISPIDDVRSTAWYRREVVKAVTHDVLRLAWQRAGKAEGKQRTDGDGYVSSAPETRPASRAAGDTLRVLPDSKHAIELTVNGEKQRLWVAPNELLINVLRESLELTGTKYGCGIGECGACTIHLNGEPALACLTLAIAADGAEVQTVEGLQGPHRELDPLQEAFIEHQAFQCGYCTPGMLMMTKRLLGEMPSATEEDVRAYLRGNRCRCTGFASIVRAVLSQVDGVHDKKGGIDVAGV